MSIFLLSNTKTFKILILTLFFASKILCILDRLLSWGGKSIEPYGIDYILQKLGFTHARITIPKWMQRGLMDPLDKSLALLTLQMLAIIKSNSQKKSTN